MKVKCPKCGHEQETKTKLLSVTCSSCQRKFQIRKRKVFKD